MFKYLASLNMNISGMRKHLKAGRLIGNPSVLQGTLLNNTL